MPLGIDPNDPEASADSMRRRARLGVLGSVGFWMAAGSVLVGFSLCFGCGLLLPQRLVPWVLLAVPAVFIVGMVLLVSASAVAQQVGACRACREWYDGGGDAATLQRCPQCGRWGRPGSAPVLEAAGVAEDGRRGFPVVVRDANTESSATRPGPDE